MNNYNNKNVVIINCHWKALLGSVNKVCIVLYCTWLTYFWYYHNYVLCQSSITIVEFLRKKLPPVIPGKNLVLREPGLVEQKTKKPLATKTLSHFETLWVQNSNPHQTWVTSVGSYSSLYSTVQTLYQR